MNTTPPMLDQLLHHAGWAHRLARRLVRDAAAADDVVQSTWCSVVRRGAEIRVAPRAWLTGAIRNAAAEWRRAAQRRARREERAATREGVTLDPAEIAQRAEGQRILADAVTTLDEPYRSTVMLRYFDDLSAADIGRRLGVPAATVRWRLMKGLDLLRERLDERHHGDRRAWCLIFIPLAGRPLLLASLKAGLIQAGKGAMVMKPATKVSAAAVLLIATLGTAFLLTRDGGDDLPRSRPATDAGAGRIVPVARSELRAPADPVVPSPFRETDPKPAATGAVASAAAGASVHVVGRCLDSDGRPIAGALAFEARFPETLRAMTTADGRFDFRLEDAALIRSLGLDTQEQDGRFVITAAGHARAVRGGRVRVGTLTDVGDVVLKPGGSLQGRVVGDAGQPIAGVLVVPCTADSRTGPDTPTPHVGFEEDRIEARAVRSLIGHLAGSMTNSESEQAAVRSALGDDQEFGVSRPWEVASAITRADGTFQVDGLPEGPTRIHATKPGWLGTTSEPVTITAGRTAEMPEIEMPPEGGKKHVLRGRVVDSGGQPVSRPWVDVGFKSTSPHDGSSRFAQHATNEGHFAVSTNLDGAWTFRVRDKSGRLGSACVPNVGCETETLTITLPQPRSFRVRATHAGKPIDGFAATLVAKDSPEDATAASSDALGHFEASAIRDGWLSVTIPAEPFAVEVEAPGFKRRRSPVLTPETVGDELTLDLLRLGSLHGRISSAGVAVGNASVVVHQAHDETTSAMINGFLSWVETPSVAEGRTDANGAYDLPVRTAGTYVVEVVAPGFPRTYSEPVAVDPAIGATHDVRIAHGGVIRGRVITAPGRSPAGTIVGVSQGGPDAETRRVQADGSFAFENLAEGPWMVRVVRREVTPDRTWSVTLKKRPPPFAWDCRVRAGETTTFDVDLSASGTPCVVEGVVPTQLAPKAEWTAALVTTEDPLGYSTRTVKGTVALDGTFRIDAEGAGTATLLLTAGGGSAPRVKIRDEVLLRPGAIRWTGITHFGTLRVGGRSGGDVRHVLRRDPGLTVETMVVRDPTGNFLPAIVPAGAAELTRKTADGEGPSAVPVVIATEGTLDFQIQ